MMTKILVYSDLHTFCSRLKKDQKKIILVTGVFDLFHQAHKEFLKRAKAIGDILLVGVESDERVKELKGENRPIDTLSIRLQNVAAHPDVDFVFALPPTFRNQAAYRELLSAVHPDILAVSRHTPFINNKQKLMHEIGGRVAVVMEQDKKVSTTKLIEKNLPVAERNKSC